MDKWIYEMIDRQADSWFVEQCQNLYAEFFVYYRPAKGVMKGDVVIAEKPPTESYLVGSQVIPIDYTRAKVRQMLIDICGHLPIIPNIY